MREYLETLSAISAQQFANRSQNAVRQGPVSHDRVVAATDKSGIVSTTIGASDNELIVSSLTFVFNQTGQLIEIKE